ncbi:GNAT family N-acetyltransferase [uncultured Treponema sp.]|uniref:GNAT family N-acetyltransferase n=1 Tax=uncultured Treponema sp. TaxID=162155 RepID=UPI0025DD8237|nr:GNAT family N-acetyltransferase [uncultured Treponema sp.]
MKIIPADKNDIPELFALQLLSFESEAEMIGSRDVPALTETAQENSADFSSWRTLKLVNDDGKIIGAIRYKEENGKINVGRLMVHPDFRRKGFAKRLLEEIDRLFPSAQKELYTCSKSWTNIALYTQAGYKPYKEQSEPTGLSFIFFRKG